MSALQELLIAGAEQGIYPSARAVVASPDALLFEGGAGAAEDAIYDLASLTKVISTTSIFLSLWAEGKVGPEAPLSRYFPDAVFQKSPLTVADLLFHRSGMIAWVPFFAPVVRVVPELFSSDCPAQTRLDIRAEVIRAALDTPLERPAHEAAVYSDVGFILLGHLLEQLGGAPLDVLFRERVLSPLGLDPASLDFRRLSARLPLSSRIQPTGLTRPREPAPGQPDYTRAADPRPSPAGEVDDDNCWVMDGVAGHAGLFGTARAVARFGQAVLAELKGAGKLAPAPLWMLASRRDPLTPGSTRAMGWDTPSAQGSSAGSRISPRALGHTGFTGTSLWVDPASERVFVLLTNRTYLGRQETRIRELRPRFHDRALEEFG